MSLSKIIGAFVGLMFGATISGLYLAAGLRHTSAPAAAVIATVLLGVLIGSAIGAYIGSDDRRRP